MWYFPVLRVLTDVRKIHRSDKNKLWFFFFISTLLMVNWKKIMKKKDRKKIQKKVITVLAHLATV